MISDNTPKAMRASQEYFQCDLLESQTETFVKICRNGNRHVLIRNRKMPLKDLMLSMIGRKGLSLTMELREYMSEAHPEMSISKPGYLKQRMKLNPEAFRYLYHFHNRQFYANTNPETAPTTYKGFLVLAADGSKINVPTTPETLEVYGTPCAQGKMQAQLGLGCVYDVLNHFVIESEIGPYRFNEGTVAEAQTYILRDTIGNAINYMLLMDRGYPSIPMFMRFIDRGIYFVARLNSAIFKAEQESMLSDDEEVTIKLTEKRREKFKGTDDEAVMKSREAFALRLVRVRLSDGQYEVLATNLPRELFPAECFAEIYHMRWGIETSYETLKSKLQLENFTGTKPILIEQDIYSSIYVYNLAENIARDVELENAQKLNNDYKYPMKINRNVCIGVLKSDLIYAIMQTDPVKKGKLMEKMYDDISKSIVPVRLDRHYEREAHKSNNKYSNTYKRSY
jgi:hypothetical protein